MTIKLQGSSSGHVNLDAKATAANNTITLPDTTGGELVALESNGDLNIDSNSLFVDASTNKVGIGTNSPDTDSILHVYQPATNSSSELLIQNNRNKNTWTRYKTSTAHWITGNYGAWDEYHIVDADTSSIKVTVNTSGDVVPSGNVVLASGKGINFDPQGANDVNLLDDYEEGTFTPTYSNGASSITYSQQNGFYIKVGKLVFGHIYLYAAATGTNSILQIGGLPFTTSVWNVRGHGSGSLSYTTSGFFGTSDDYPIIHLPSANTILGFYKVDGGINGDDTGINNKELMLTFQYMID